MISIKLRLESIVAALFRTSVFLLWKHLFLNDRYYLGLTFSQ